MAQGQAFTKEQKDSIVKSLIPYLEMGFSRNKACEFIGLTPQTLSVWVNDDEALLMKITGAENAINTTVMANLRDAILRESELPEDLRKENSWKWAERRMKNDFSLKQETDVTTNGESIQPILVKFLDDGNTTQNNRDTEGV